jgi:NTP pyrophosphatase (non-canonical NTP hydrolase)
MSELTFDKKVRFVDMFREVQRECHNTSMSKGWYDSPRSFGECVSLFHAELSEALEADRKNKGESEKIPGFSCIEEEFADLFIRVMDTSEFMNLRLAEAILAKNEYNKGREHRHGGLKY